MRSLPHVIGDHFRSVIRHSGSLTWLAPHLYVFVTLPVGGRPWWFAGPGRYVPESPTVKIVMGNGEDKVRSRIAHTPGTISFRNTGMFYDR